MHAALLRHTRVSRATARKPTLNLPLIQDRFALRLVGYLDDVAGYIDNVMPAQAPFDYSAVVANLTGGALSVPPGTLMTPATPAINNEDIDSISTTGGRVSARWQATDQLRFDLMLGTQSAEMDSESGVTPDEYTVARTLDLFVSPARKKISISQDLRSPTTGTVFR